MAFVTIDTEWNRSIAIINIYILNLYYFHDV